MHIRLGTIVCVALLLGCSRPEEHRIPAGVQGDVYILTGYRNGARSKREAGKIVFDIPRARILVTQDEPSDGWHVTSFYYVDQFGKRRKMDYEPSTIARTAANSSDHRPIVWFMRNGEINSLDLPCSIRFMQYCVGTPADLLARTVDQENEQQVRLEQYVRANRICP
jgi:hypothetical protein